MNDRVSEIILLCEDDPQEQLVRAFLKTCGLNTKPPMFRSRNASRAIEGGNVTWVLREFQGELTACRQRHAKANTLLIVVVDADDNDVVTRKSHLVAEPRVVLTDPLVVLIPKRHIETWIRAATNQTVNETDDYKAPEPKKQVIRTAAKIIYDWARNTPPPGPTCVPSLHSALSEWRKIG
jgi:hypothetical protein